MSLIMKNILFLFMVFGITICMGEYPFIAQNAEEPKNCTQAGPMCETCHISAYCLEIEPGVFEKRQRKSCSSDETCSASLKRCTTETNPACSATGLPFLCGDTSGTYPHPVDWSVYVMCVPQIRNNKKVNIAVSVSCPDGYFYNPATTYCSIPSNCTSLTATPVPECTKSTVPSANPLNKSIFFVCGEYSTAKKVLYPFQDICPKGGEFKSGRCISGKDNGCSNDTTDAPVSPSVPTIGPTGPPSTCPTEAPGDPTEISPP